jgi:hypothetical protein
VTTTTTTSIVESIVVAEYERKRKTVVEAKAEVNKNQKQVKEVDQRKQR